MLWRHGAAGRTLKEAENQMREKINYTIITFDTTAQAVAMEKYCTAQGIPGRLIPVPAAVSAGCGICWRMKTEEYSVYQDLVGNLAYGAVAAVRL